MRETHFISWEHMGTLQLSGGSPAPWSKELEGLEGTKPRAGLKPPGQGTGAQRARRRACETAAFTCLFPWRCQPVRGTQRSRHPSICWVKGHLSLP